MDGKEMGITIAGLLATFLMPWPGGGHGGREGEGGLHTETTQLEASIRLAHGNASPFVPAGRKGGCARPVSAASARLAAASEGQLAR